MVSSRIARNVFQSTRTRSRPGAVAVSRRFHGAQTDAAAAAVGTASARLTSDAYLQNFPETTPFSEANKSGPWEQCSPYRSAFAGLLVTCGAFALLPSQKKANSRVKCEGFPQPSEGGNGRWQGEPKNQSQFARSWQNEKIDKNKRSKDDFILISGNANLPLAGKVAEHLGVTLSTTNLGRFSDGETKLQIETSCRGKDIFIIQPTQPPVNDNIMDLLIMISTCRRASAKRITAVLPYYGYGRADRKNARRIPITAADVATLLTSMGVDRVVAVDLHCGAIQGFFPPSIPMDNLSAMSIGEEYFAQHKEIRKCCVVSPDAGGVYRARKFQEGMVKRGAEFVSLAMLVKQRSQANAIAQMDLVGDVRGLDVIIVDDMVDTGGTLCEAVNLLKQAGAKRVFAYATHGVLSGPALERISKSSIEELVVTDSIYSDDGRHSNPKIKICSLAVLIADGLRRIYLKESLSWD